LDGRQLLSGLVGSVEHQFVDLSGLQERLNEPAAQERIDAEQIAVDVFAPVQEPVDSPTLNPPENGTTNIEPIDVNGGAGPYVADPSSNLNPSDIDPSDPAPWKDVGDPSSDPGNFDPYESGDPAFMGDPNESISKGGKKKEGDLDDEGEPIYIVPEPDDPKPDDPKPKDPNSCSWYDWLCHLSKAITKAQKNQDNKTPSPLGVDDNYEGVLSGHRDSKEELINPLVNPRNPELDSGSEGGPLSRLAISGGGVVDDLPEGVDNGAEGSGKMIDAGRIFGAVDPLPEGLTGLMVNASIDVIAQDVAAQW